MKTLGQIAYEKIVLDWPWLNLSAVDKKRWEDAAKAVADEIMRLEHPWLLTGEKQ